MVILAGSAFVGVIERALEWMGRLASSASAEAGLVALMVKVAAGRLLWVEVGWWGEPRVPVGADVHCPAAVVVEHPVVGGAYQSAVG